MTLHAWKVSTKEALGAFSQLLSSTSYKGWGSSKMETHSGDGNYDNDVDKYTTCISPKCFTHVSPFNPHHGLTREVK